MRITPRSGAASAGLSLATRNGGLILRCLTILAAGLVAIAMAGQAGAWCLAVAGHSGAHHPNGGGWVEETATVADSVHVGPRARICDSPEVSGNVRIDARNYGAFVYNNARVYGNAKVIDALVTGNGKVDCGTWKQISVRTDRTGECGLNGSHPRQPRVNDLLGTLDLSNTQSPDVRQWGDGSLLSNPLDPGDTGLGE